MLCGCAQPAGGGGTGGSGAPMARYVARGVWLRCARWRATAFAVYALLASLTRVHGCWPGPVRMRSLWGLRRGRLSGRWPCCPHSMRTRVATAARPEGRVVWCPGCARGGCVVVERGGAGPLPVLSRCACVLACCLRYCASLLGWRLRTLCVPCSGGWCGGGGGFCEVRVWDGSCARALCLFPSSPGLVSLSSVRP